MEFQKIQIGKTDTTFHTGIYYSAGRLGIVQYRGDVYVVKNDTVNVYVRKS